MEQLIEDVTRGNVTEVKVMLASVVLASPSARIGKLLQRASSSWHAAVSLMPRH